MSEMQKRGFTIHDLPESERPRERLQKHGPEVLSSQELLALLLGRGIKGESVMVTAQRLLSTFGNIENISQASLEELSDVKGVGPAKASQIKAAFELGLNPEHEKLYKQNKFSVSRQISFSRKYHKSPISNVVTGKVKINEDQ